MTGCGVEEGRVALLRQLSAWICQRGRVEHKVLLQHVANPIRGLKAAGIHPLLEELVQRGYIRADGKAWEARP